MHCDELGFQSVDKWGGLDENQDIALSILIYEGVLECMW